MGKVYNLPLQLEANFNEIITYSMLQFRCTNFKCGTDCILVDIYYITKPFDTCILCGKWKPQNCQFILKCGVALFLVHIKFFDILRSI